MVSVSDTVYLRDKNHQPQTRHAIDLKLTGVVVDEILKHPEKQFYKTNFFKDTLSIGDVDDGDNSTPFR